jgi:hypothetical protein
LLPFASSDGVAGVCPNPDSDVRALRRDMFRSIAALEKQIKSLAQRLLRAELRLKELEGDRPGTWKKLSDP